MKNYLILLSALCITVLVACPGKPPTGNNTPRPEPTLQENKIGPLELCSGDRTKFCYKSEVVFIRGYSDYGAFSIPFQYETVLRQYHASGINFVRQWASPIPRDWGGLQPYRFTDPTTPEYVEEYWRNADSYIDLAAKYGIWVMVDLTDHYGVYRNDTFSTNPLNRANGGPLKQGIPDLYTNPVIQNMIELSVKRLSKHKNVVYQICNEPGGGSVTQLINFHKQASLAIKRLHPTALVGINPIPDANKRPVVPNAQEVGADFITVHEAGIENIKDANSCLPDVLAKRLIAIQTWNRVAVIADTDALYNTRNPCNRENNKVLEAITEAAKSVAGVNHRDSEIELDKDAIKALTR